MGEVEERKREREKGLHYFQLPATFEARKRKVLFKFTRALSRTNFKIINSLFLGSIIHTTDCMKTNCHCLCILLYTHRPTQVFVFSAIAEGIPADNPHLVLLFFMSQLFLRELTKCHRLVQIIPMDMSGYYGQYMNNHLFIFADRRRLPVRFPSVFQITGPVRQIWETLLAKFFYVNK